MASPGARRGRNVSWPQVLALLGAFVLVASLGGVLTAGLAMPLVASAGTVANTSSEFFDQLPTSLEQKPLSQQSRIYAADGSLLATLYWENRIIVPLSKVSKIMQRAVVATEDKRFYEHGGIDPQGLVRAAIKNATTTDVQGASTLTQQYVKNVLIEAAAANGDAAGVEAARETTLIRKLREAKLAIALEKRMTKDEILESYLNIAQFGASVYGVEAAARQYFGKSAKDVTYIEAALLAGVTQSPNRWDPINNPEAAKERRDVVLGLMRDQGIISQKNYKAAVKVTIKRMLAHSTQDKPGCKAAGDAGFFCDYVTKIIRNDPAFGKTEAARIQLLYRGGLQIYTTLDPRLQAIATAEVRRTVPDLDPSGLASTLVSVVPGTGQIVAMAQDRTYDPSSKPPAGSTSVNYNSDQNLGGSTGFQPGSSFKPFVLTDWLEKGHSLSEIVDGTVKVRPMTSFRAACKGAHPFVEGAKPYRPQNAEGHGSGHISVLQATAKSVNTAFMDMANQLDLCDILGAAERMGLHQANGQDVSIGPAMALGTPEVAPLTMAAAYATFAANGTFCEPVAITKVLDPKGKELAVPSANCRSAVEPRITAAVNHALREVLVTGTGKQLRLSGGRVAAGKTGTSNGSVAGWFVGYTPQLATAAWVGNPDRSQELMKVTINGRYWRVVYGADLAGPTWQRFMDQALAGLPSLQFPPVGSKELYGERVRVPNVVGSSIDSAKRQLIAAGFHVTVATPPMFSPTAPAGTVAGTTPSAGSSTARGGFITIIPSMGPDPNTPKFPFPGGPDAPPSPGATGPGDSPGPGRGH